MLIFVILLYRKESYNKQNPPLFSPKYYPPHAILSRKNLHEMKLTVKSISQSFLRTYEIDQTPQNFLRFNHVWEEADDTKKQEHPEAGLGGLRRHPEPDTKPQVEVKGGQHVLLRSRTSGSSSASPLLFLRS